MQSKEVDYSSAKADFPQERLLVLFIILQALWIQVHSPQHPLLCSNQLHFITTGWIEINVSLVKLFKQNQQPLAQYHEKEHSEI